MPFEYFNRMLSSKNPIIKVDNCEFIIYTPSGNEKTGIGFRGETKCKAGNLNGRIEINVVFVVPEGEEITVAANDEKLNQMIDSLEFIKMTDKLTDHDFGSAIAVLRQSNDEPV